LCYDVEETKEQEHKYACEEEIKNKKYNSVARQNSRNTGNFDDMRAAAVL
jgi:hypothetical protein